MSKKEMTKAQPKQARLTSGGAGRSPLRLPRCGVCAQFHYPPKDRCPYCLAAVLEWARCSGQGSVYSFVARHPSALDGRGKGIEVIAVVELAEGPKVLARFSGVDRRAESTKVNMPVLVFLVTTPNGETAFEFRPA